MSHFGTRLTCRDVRLKSASLIGRSGSSTSDCPPLQFRCRSRARASLRTRHLALPSWVSKTRWNNLLVGLARRTAGSSGPTNSPHPSSREGHYSTTQWSHPPDNEQRFDQHSQVGKVLDK